MKRIPWPFGAGPPRLDWVQVEVTSRCNAACRYCPRAAYAGVWRSGDLEMPLFLELLDQVRPGTLVYLQGWGEPLLHPDLVRMVEAAAARGFPVATTSNGILLDGDRQRALAGAGLEILGLSLVGVDRRNDAIRVGTSAAEVLRAVESLARLREGAGGPRIHIAYLVLRRDLDHLPEAVRSLGEAGADQVVVSSLDLISDPALARETLWDPPEDPDHLLEVVQAAEEAARASGTEVIVQVALPGAGGRCPENTGRSLYVGHDGGVMPCVMSAVPVSRRVTHWGPRGPAAFERVPLGNLHDEPLSRIWKKRAFRRFRRGVVGWGPTPERCRDCYKTGVRRIQESEQEIPVSIVGS